MAETRRAKASKGKGFTQAEKSAMRQRVKELQTEKVDGESAIRDAIAEMEPADRALATRLHAIIKASAPQLESRLWYGMPAYAKGGKTICFFQPARKFKMRYGTLGFNDPANLDDGHIWPVAFAVKELTAADEARVEALVKKAAG